MARAIAPHESIFCILVLFLYGTDLFLMFKNELNIYISKLYNNYIVI